jgi:hypothetical protein
MRSPDGWLTYVDSAGRVVEVEATSHNARSWSAGVTISPQACTRAANMATRPPRLCQPANAAEVAHTGARSDSDQGQQRAGARVEELRGHSLGHVDQTQTVRMTRSMFPPITF